MISQSELGRSQFYANGGERPENKQGKYQCTRILWSSEDLNKKAVKYVGKGKV